MRLTSISLILLCVLLMATPVVAEAGRYQMVTGRVYSNGYVMLILDTEKGYLWKYQDFQFKDRQSEMLIYLGQVKPQNKMGDYIDGISSPLVTPNVRKLAPEK